MDYPIVGADNVAFSRDLSGNGLSALSLTTLQPVYLDNTATVTYRVQDATFADLAGESWPQSAVYIPDSPGVFMCLIRSAVALVAHEECWLVIEVDFGPDAHRTFQIPLHPLAPEDGGMPG